MEFHHEKYGLHVLTCFLCQAMVMRIVLLTRPLGRVIGVGLSPAVGGKKSKMSHIVRFLKNGPTEKLFSFTDISTWRALILRYHTDF